MEGTSPVSPNLPDLRGNEQVLFQRTQGLMGVLEAIAHWIEGPLSLQIDTSAQRMMAIDDQIIKMNEDAVEEFDHFYNETMKEFERRAEEDLYPNPEEYDTDLPKDHPDYVHYLDPESPTYNENYSYDDELVLFNSEYQQVQAEFDVTQSIYNAAQEVLDTLSLSAAEAVPAFLEFEKILVDIMDKVIKETLSGFRSANQVSQAVLR